MDHRRYALAVKAGIAANLALALPMLFVPVFALRLMRLPIPDQLVWPRLAALLVVAVSMMYLPQALDPASAGRLRWLPAASRAAVGTFFLLQGGPFLPLAAFDLGFGALQAAALLYPPRGG